MSDAMEKALEKVREAMKGGEACRVALGEIRDLIENVDEQPDPPELNVGLARKHDELLSQVYDIADGAYREEYL